MWRGSSLSTILRGNGPWGGAAAASGPRGRPDSASTGRDGSAARARQGDSSRRGVAVAPWRSNVGMMVERRDSRRRRARHVGTGLRGGVLQ